MPVRRSRSAPGAARPADGDLVGLGGIRESPLQLQDDSRKPRWTRKGMTARPLDPFVQEDPDAASFEDARLAKLLEYWRALPRAGDLPAAQAIDPAALVFILGWLMIMDPIEDGADFSYRLYGTNIAEVMGRDLTGCKLSESFPEVAAFTANVYRNAMRDRRPVLTRHTPPWRIVVTRWERLI